MNCTNCGKSFSEFEASLKRGICFSCFQELKRQDKVKTHCRCCGKESKTELCPDCFKLSYDELEEGK